MKILDVCANKRMFYFDKENIDTIYCDLYFDYKDNIKEDVTKLSFDNNTFDMVVFDPPHIQEDDKNNNRSIMAKKYGMIRGSLFEFITSAFNECFRVLKNDGVLIFKWNNRTSDYKQLLELSPYNALFGTRTKKSVSETWFIVFYKSSNMLKSNIFNTILDK
jgi:SAM-dependent methyltransferase